MGFALAAALSFHIGAGVGGAHTANQDYGSIEMPNTRPNGLVFSLEAQLEYGPAFLAPTLLLSNGFDGLQLTCASVRAGLFLLPTAVSPYVAAGGGWLREQMLDSDEFPALLAPNGGALLGEVGIAAFRDRKRGRASAFLQVLQPLFSDPPYAFHGHPHVQPAWIAGLRVLY